MICILTLENWLLQCGCGEQAGSVGGATHSGNDLASSTMDCISVELEKHFGKRQL